MKKVKRERSTTTTGHYVKNADLLPAVIEAKQLGFVTNKLITMIQMIADRYSRKGSFGGYSFREDMVSSAVENLCKNALKFNHEKYNNPFAFYTTAIHHSFLQYMAEEKKHRNIRDRLLLDAGANPSFNFLDKEKDDHDHDIKESDEIVIEIVESEDSTEPQQEETESVQDAPNLESTDEVKEKVVFKEQKIRYRDRAPGPVTRYGPGDFELDPITGAYILKKKYSEDVVMPPATHRIAKITEHAAEVTLVSKDVLEKQTPQAAAKKTVKAVVKKTIKTPAKKVVKAAAKKVPVKQPKVKENKTSSARNTQKTKLGTTKKTATKKPVKSLARSKKDKA